MNIYEYYVKGKVSTALGIWAMVCTNFTKNTSKIMYFIKKDCIEFCLKLRKNEHSHSTWLELKEHILQSINIKGIKL